MSTIFATLENSSSFDLYATEKKITSDPPSKFWVNPPDHVPRGGKVEFTADSESSIKEVSFWVNYEGREGETKLFDLTFMSAVPANVNPMNATAKWYLSKEKIVNVYQRPEDGDIHKKVQLKVAWTLRDWPD